MFGMNRMIREVYDYRELLLAMVYRDIQVRYKQAVMGVLWAFFMPILGILAGIMIQVALAFTRGARLEMTNVASVMVRTLPWMLFIQILSNTANGILGGMGLASRIYFPRQIIPLASMLTVFVDFAISALAITLLLVLIPFISGTPADPARAVILVDNDQHQELRLTVTNGQSQLKVTDLATGKVTFEGPVDTAQERQPVPESARKQLEQLRGYVQTSPAPATPTTRPTATAAHSPLVFSWALLWIPLLMLPLVLTGLGLGLLFGSANMFFRDVKYILQVLLQFGVFFTPVYVFVGQLGRFGLAMLWNPVAAPLEAIASVALKGELPWNREPYLIHLQVPHLFHLEVPFLFYSALLGIVLTVAGIIVFRKTEHLFAEVM